jgi:hypothetical protein
MTNPEFANSGEMVASTLRGYRSWNLKPIKTNIDSKPEWRLGSVGVNAWWDGIEIVADCTRKGDFTPAFLWPGHQAPVFPHEAPDATCTCGIYGWYEPEYALRLHSGSVLGVVEYSGRILLGSKGFRAEKAKIIALSPGANPSTIDQYSKAIHFIDSIEEFCEIVGLGGNKPGSVVSINYEGLQEFLSKRLEKEKLKFKNLMEKVITDTGVEFFTSHEEMKAKYPPDLGTVKNIIGTKLERYVDGGRTFPF